MGEDDGDGGAISYSDGFTSSLTIFSSLAGVGGCCVVFGFAFLLLPREYFFVRDLTNDFSTFFLKSRDCIKIAQN